MKAVGESVQPNRRVISELENYPYRNEKISWRRSVRNEGEEKQPTGETETPAK